MSRRLRAHAAVLALLAVPTLALGACSGVQSDPRSTQSSTQVSATATAPATGAARSVPSADGQARQTVASSTAGSAGANSVPRRAPARAADLAGDFAALTAEHGEDLVIAWAPVGAPKAVQSLGSLPDDEAWSTLKVPIAVAASQQADGRPSARVRELMRQAITVSDNEAAAALWHGLGGAPATEVDAVLRAGGDATTRAARDGQQASTPFGRTTWRPADQARFAAMLPCLKDSGPVLDLMAEVQEEHRWGLGRLKGAAIKGGWGISPQGHLVRQLGVVSRGSDGRAVGIALAVQPVDGTHASGTAALDDAARWITSRLGPADAGRCPSS